MNALLVSGELDVVDIRDTQEWSDGHIPGARLVPLDDLRADPEKTLPRSNIVFVCGQGLRSLTAAKLADPRRPATGPRLAALCQPTFCPP
jgi:rhodanese-related sulfurtransferase